MSHPIVRALPDRPHLDQLKAQAKTLLRQTRAGDPEALAFLKNYHPGSREPKAVALHDAQLVVARLHGFASWAKLKQEVEARRVLQLPWEERLLRFVWQGRLEDVVTTLDNGGEPAAQYLPRLAEALAGIADRSVWHRPFFRDMARHLIRVGVACDIWAAARLGLLDNAQQCVEENADLLTAEDSYGRTPMQRAALLYGSDENCEAVVMWLREQGAPVDLHTACTFAWLDEAKQALERDPSQIERHVQGSTPLNWAVRPRGSTSDPTPPPDIAICDLLLQHGANLETRDEQENGMHPLHHLGEWRNNVPLAEWLLKQGAKLDAHDDIGWTPLDYALDRNREAMIDLFRRHGAKETRVNWPNSWGERREAFLSATKRGDLSVIESLLKEDPSLATARGEDGDTPLHWAAHDGHYEMAALLLQHGADVSAQETRYWGGTPLHWAAERQPVLVELLLDHGAQVNCRNERTGQTPLHYCGRCDDVAEVAQLLLSRGADAGLTDNLGNRALDYAKKRGNKAVAQALS